MIADDLGKQLHDRATRGESLSSEEHALLERWYRQLDDAERQLWDASSPEGTLASLRGQVDTALAQLMATAERIRQVASENETLRRENIELRNHLADWVALQSA